MTFTARNLKSLMKIQQHTAALEAELDEQQVRADVAMDESLDAADAAEPMLLDVQQDRNDIATARMDIDNVREDIGQLEQTADELEATEDTGGADALDVELAEVAIERICTSLGIPRIKMPSTEAFASQRTRLRATQVAVEDLRETASKAWAAVKEGMKKLGEKTKAALGKLFQVDTAIAERAQELAKAASELAGQEKPSEGTPFKSKTLSSGSGPATLAEMGSLLTEMANSPAEMSRLIKAYTVLADRLAVSGKVQTPAIACKGADIGEGANNFYKTQIGTKFGPVAMPASRDEEVYNAAAALQFVFVQPGAPVELPLLAAKDAAKLAAAVKNAMDKQLAGKSDVYSLVDENWDLGVDSASTTDNTPFVKKQTRAINQVIDVAYDVALETIGYNSHICKAILDYVQASLKAYRK